MLSQNISLTILPFCCTIGTMDTSITDLERLWEGDVSASVRQTQAQLQHGLARSETAKPIAQRNERYVHQMDSQEEDNATV